MNSAADVAETFDRARSPSARVSFSHAIFSPRLVAFDQSPVVVKTMGLGLFDLVDPIALPPPPPRISPLRHRLSSTPPRYTSPHRKVTEGHQQTIGHRKKNRLETDRALFVDPPTKDELRALTTHCPSGHFDSLFASQYQLRRMDQLLNVSLEEQEKILRQLGCYPKNGHSSHPEFNTPDAMFSRVNTRSRALLKRSSHLEFIRNFETRIFRAIMSRLDPWISNEQILLLELDSFHRLLGHGVCQFHGLKSSSVDQPNGDRMFSVTYMEGAQTPRRIFGEEGSFGMFLLADFLERHSDSA